MTAASPIAAVGRFVAQTWNCRYFWYALACMPSVMVLFSIFEIIKFLEDSRDYPLGWSKYGWAFAAERNYVFNIIIWDIYFGFIIFGAYIFKSGSLNILARILLIGFWGYIALKAGRDV